MSNKKQEQLDLYFSPHGETLKASASTLKDNPVGTSDYINEKQKSLHSPRGYYDPDVFLSPQKFVQKYNPDNVNEYRLFKLSVIGENNDG